MFWWRHTGGPPPEGSPSKCPSTGDPWMSPASPALSNDEEEAVSAEWEDKTVGNVKRSRDREPNAPHRPPARAARFKPLGGSVRRCLTNSPRKRRSRLRSHSFAMNFSDIRNFSPGAIDIINPSRRSAGTGSDCLSLNSEEYLSACSDLFSSPAPSEGKDVSFFTGTASPQSDSGSASIEPPYHESLSSDFRLHAASFRVATDDEDRQRSAPEGAVGTPIITAFASVRSLSLPLLGPRVATTTSPLPAGAPLASFRWICRSPSNNEGESDQQPLHVQMKALASQASLDHHGNVSSGRLTPHTPHAMSRSSSKEEISQAQEEHGPGFPFASSSHDGPRAAQNPGGEEEQWGSQPPCELDTSPVLWGGQSLVGNLATPYGPADTPEPPSVGIIPEDRGEEAVDADQLNDLQAETGIDEEHSQSKSFHPRTNAAEVLGPADSERRSRSWTARNARNSFDQLPRSSSSAEHLPVRLVSCPQEAGSFRHLAGSRESSEGEEGKIKALAQESCGGALFPSRRSDIDSASPNTVGEDQDVGTPRRTDSIGNNSCVSNGDGISEPSSIHSDGSYSCSCSSSWSSSSCSSSCSSSSSNNSSCICSQRSSSVDSRCRICTDNETPITLHECGDARLGDLDGRLSDASSARCHDSREASRENSDCRSNTEEESKSFTSDGQTPEGGERDIEAGHAVAEPKQEEVLIRQGSTHDADTLHLPEHGFPGAPSDPSADGQLPVAQAVCPSCPEICMESSQNLGDGVGEPASADCSTGDVHGVEQALAEASQQAVAEIADETVDGTSHPEAELQAAAADSDRECGEEREGNGLAVEHTLDHSLVSIADALHPGLVLSEQRQDGPELTACSPPVEEQEKQQPHLVPLPPSSSSATDLSLSSCSPTEASYLPTRFSCTANATTEQEKKPMSEVCSGSEARSSSEDPQERQTIHGASPAIVPEAGASSSTRLGSGLDAAAAKQSHPDAEEAGREATEPKREVSRGSEGKNSCVDTQESHAKQRSSTERAQEAGASLWSSFWSALTPVEDTSRVFQDAADVAVGDAEEPKREVSLGGQGLSSCDMEGRPAGPEASANSVQGGGLCSLGLVGEAAATDDSFQDPSNHSEEEAEESCVEELPGNEGRNASGVTQEKQTNQQGSPESAQGRDESCSLVAIRQAVAADDSFQDASNGSEQEAEASKGDVSLDSAGGNSFGDMQEHQPSQPTSAYSSLNVDSSLCISFGSVRESSEASESSQNPSNGFVGVDEEPPRELPLGSEDRSSKGDTQERDAKQEASADIVEGVDVSCSLGSVDEAAGAGNGFQDASSGFEDEAEGPRRETSRVSEGRSSPEDAQGCHAKPEALPITMEGAGVSDSVVDAAVDDESFLDATAVTGGEATVTKREVSRDNEGRRSCGDAQERHSSQEGLLPAVQGAGIFFGLSSIRDTAVAEESFQDASDGSEGEAEELRRDACRGSEGRSSSVATEELQARQTAAADCVQGGAPSSCRGVDSLREAVVIDESFQDASNSPDGGKKEPSRGVSRGSDGGSSCGGREERQASEDAPPVIVISSASVRDAAVADESFQDARNGSVEVMEEPKLKVLGGMPYGDRQERQASNGGLPASDDGARASLCSSLDSDREAPVTDESFQDVSHGSEEGAEKSKREASPVSEGRSSSGNVQEREERQAAPPDTAQGVGTSLCSSLGSGSEAAVTDESFQDVSNGFEGEAEEPRGEASCGSDGRSSSGDKEEPQARQCPQPVSTAILDGASFSFGPVREAAVDDKCSQPGSNGSVQVEKEPQLEISGGRECSNPYADRKERQTSNGDLSVDVERADTSFSSGVGSARDALDASKSSQDGSNVFGEETEMPKCEISRISEDRSSFGHMKGPSLDSGRGADPSLCSSLSSVRESVETSKSFQDASNGSGGEAAEPEREVSRGSEGRRSCEDTQRRQAKQSAAPVQVQGAAEAPYSSFASCLDAAAAEQSHHDASEEAGRQATEPKREVSRGSEGRNSCGDTHERNAKKGPSTERAQEAGASLWSSFWSAFTPVEDTGRVFQDAVDVAIRDTEEPKREGSRGSQGISSCEDREARPAGPEASADSVQGGGVRSVDSVCEATAAESNFQDPSNGSVEEMEGPKREMSRVSEGRSSSGDTGERPAGQRASPDSGQEAGASCSLGLAREATAADESFQDASNGSEGEVEERMREASRSSEGRSSSGDTEVNPARQQASPDSGQEAGASCSLGLAREAAAADESFQDASNGSEGEVEERMREASRSSEGRSSSGDAGERPAGQQASPDSGQGAGASCSLGLAREAAAADESFQDASNGSEGEVEERMREASRNSALRSSSGDTGERPARQQASPDSGQGAGTPCILGLVGEAAAGDESFQDASNGSEREAEEPSGEFSRGSEGRSSSGNTQERQPRQGARANEGNSAHSLESQDALYDIVSHSDTDPGHNRESPLGESLERQTTKRNRSKNGTGNSREPVVSSSAGESDALARWWKCTTLGSGDYSRREQRRQIEHVNHGQRETCSRLQEQRSSDGSQAYGLQCPPRGHSGSPSRTAEAEENTASCNNPVNSDSRRSGDTPQGGRGSSRDADSHGNFTGTERYYIGSRSSSDASSSGSSSDNGGSSSGSESGSSSSDSSTSRSSGCSSCYSNEGGYQSTENIPSNISSDSGVYETWSSCREFSRRPFGGTRDYEPPVGETEGRISPPFVSTASRVLAPDNTEVEEENKPVQGSPRTLEGEETAHWQDVHAGMRVDTPTRSILSAPSSQASLASRQPLAAGNWPHPASGLAAALSSLAHLVFSSRDPRATATHSEYAAPCAQQRGAAHDDSVAAAPEQPREGEHPSLDSQSGVQGSSEASREQEKNYSNQRDSRELEDNPCAPRLVSDSNAESDAGTQSLNISVRGNSVGKYLPEAKGDGIYGSHGPAGAGMALHGSHFQADAAEESRDIREAGEGQQKAIGESKKRSFSRDNSNSGRGVALSKQQVGPMMPHLLGRRRFALRRHSGSFHVPHEALRLCSDLPAGSEQLEAECRPPDPPRRRSTFSGAFLPTHSKVRRRPNRGSFISDSSEGLAEDGSNSSGPGSRRDASIESSISGAGGTSSSSRESSSRKSSASEGYRTCSMFRALPSEESGGESERPVATKKSMSTNSQSSRTGSGCGLHVVHDEARKRHLTTDSPGRRSFSETPADVQLDKRRRTRWHSCLDPLTDYEDAAVRSMQELPPLGRLRKLASQRTQPGTCYREQPSAPSEPMLASANSTAWGGSKPLGMAATNRILESAVEFALHKHQRRPGDRIRADRLRSEKLKMLLGGAEDEEPLEERMPGVPGSASVDSLEGHPSPVPYKGTMKKRLALHQPALACRMPSHIFCGNFMSASSLWTLQLWRPVAGEDGERPVLSRSSSEAFRKEDSGLKASLQKEGYSTEEEAFRSASSEETLPALSVQPAKRLSRSPINSLLDEVLDFTFFEFGSASARRRSSGVGPSGSTAKASQGQAREDSANFQPNNMPKPRRPWACGEPVSVAEEEPRSAIRTYIHRPGCTCPLCLSGWGAAGQAGGAPVERHADTYLSPEVPTPRFQAGLPVIPSPPGGYAATSPMRIISSPLGPYPGYGPCSGNTIRVESPTRVRYGVGENITAPVSYFEQQGGKVSIPTVQSVYPAEGLQIPRIQTSPCNDWPPAQKPHIPERSSVHPSASYPLTADEKQLQERYSHVRPACIPSVPPHAPSHDPLHNKNPISAVSSRAVSYDELEKLRAQQEQQQKEAEELRRRQEELEKEQNKQREELELERQQLKEQRERLEEQRHALEKEKQDMLSAHLLGTSKSRNRGFESSSGVCKGSPERLPVSNTDEAFDIQRNTTSRTQQGPPIRHTTSTSNIVRSITGSAFGELQSDVRHGGLAVDADGTEEKDISSTVGGRQQTLQPPAASGRFFSRTASVDTNDDKEPILSPQEDLQTDPSMALSTALDKLSKIRMKLDTLQQQLEVQSQEVSSYYSALKAADQVHSSLQQTAADCRVCYGRRHTQMQEVEKRLSVLTAQDLHPCSVDELEELAQELEGTQYKLTVVQAQRAGGAAEEGRKKPKQLLPYSSSCLPEPKSSFAIPEEPVARIGPDECVAVQESALQEIKALGDDLEHIKTVHCEYKRAYKRLQGIMTQQVNGYDVDLQKLVAIEKNLEEKLRRLLFLNGDANYAELSDAQMQEYFRIVNLSIRKVYRELALRESGDRRRNEPRTSGPRSRNDCGQARNDQSRLDAWDNEPAGTRKHSGDTTVSNFSPQGNNIERSQPLRHNFQGNAGTTRNPVPVPFVAGSAASSIATQRMLVHDSRLTPRQTSAERGMPLETFIGQ